MRRSNSSVRKLWDRARAVLVAFLMVAMTIPLYSLPVFGQATTGTVKGTVSDQTGAVVVGAKVVVKNQDTGVESAVFTTSSTGDYRIPSLIPGKYRVTIEAASFKRSVTTDVDVRLGLETNVNATLQPGGVSEEITVTSAGENQVQTDTSQISTSFETRKVQDLPSNAAGGGIDTLALLAPGVVPGFGNVNSNGVTLSVNGNRARSNNFTIDGTDNNDLSIGGPSYFVDNQDSVQEFQIITNNYSAQYGRNQGAIVNIVTKSGTNDFHGSAFEFYRDSGALDALDNIQKAQGFTKPPFFLSNTFGFTAGGPIKKDKIFFFGSYQGIRQPSSFVSSSGSIAILPSEFTRLATAFPSNAYSVLSKQTAFALTNFGTITQRGDRTLRTTYPNVVSSGQFPCQNTPAGSAAPTGAQDFIALPDAGGCATLFAAAFPQRTFSTPFTGNEYSIRGDVNINSKNTVNARFLHQNNSFVNNLGDSNGFTGDVPATSQNLSGTYNRTISSRAVNEFRATYQKLAVLFGGGCSDPLTGCIPNPSDIDKAYTNVVFGLRGVLTNSTLQTVGGATNLPQGREVKVYQFTDNFSYTRGKHQMIMGLDFHRLSSSVPFLPNVNGAFRINTAATLINNLPTQITLAAGQSILNYKEADFFGYFQDDFKVRDNLTLNLGVRYENTGQPINLLHTLTTDRESNAATAVWRQNIPLDQRTVPFIPTDKNNWAPRIGFAYSPKPGNSDFMKKLLGSGSDTVIRGGYSIAYDASFYNILLNVSTSAPVVFNNTIQNNATTIFHLPANPTGDVVRGSLGSFLQKNTFDPRFLNETLVSNNFHSPYSQQWSFGVQRQITRNNVAEIRYVGNHGVGLFQSLNSNPRIDALTNGVAGFPGFPAFASGFTPLVCTNNPATPDNEGACNGRIVAGHGLIRTRGNTASSNYNGLQMRYNGRFRTDLTFGAAYTWSKAMDNASEIFSFGEGAFAANPLNPGKAERGISGFDRPNAFSFNFIYDIPFFKNKEGIAGKVLNGWQLNGTWVIASGRPFTVSQVAGLLTGATYEDTTFQSTFVGLDAVRPFLGNPNAPPTSVGITGADAAFLFGVGGLGATTLYSATELNTTGNIVTVTKDQVRYIINGPQADQLFGTPFGNVPRNGERGARLNQANFGIFKNTKFKERFTIQYRAEFFNVFNHPNSGYGVAAGADLFDNVIEDVGFGFNDRTQAELGYRKIQFALRITF